MKFVIPVAGFGGFVRSGLSFFVFFCLSCSFSCLFRVNSLKATASFGHSVIQSFSHQSSFISHQSLLYDSASVLKSIQNVK